MPVSLKDDGVGRRVRHNGLPTCPSALCRRRVRYNGLSTCPSALCRQRVLPPHGFYRAPCPSHAPVNDGPLNCRPCLGVKRRRTTARRLAFINLSVYLSQKVCICISFISLFPDPWGREEGTGGRDTRAGTNVTKLQGQTYVIHE